MKVVIYIFCLFVISQNAFSQLGLGCSTSSEQIAGYDQTMMNYVIQENNLSNQMTWIDAPRIHSLAGMYNATKDIKYLNKMIELVDQFESKKNNVSTGVLDFYMNKRVPTWPSYAKDGNPNHVYTNIVQTSMLLSPIVTCAKTILSEPTLLDLNTNIGGITGTTYREKANYYIKSSLESVNFFIDNGWFNEETNLFEYISRESKDFHPVTNSIEPLAFNRMFSMGRTMKELSLACELTGESKYNTYINLTENVLNSMVAYFKKNIFIETKNGETQYSWYYKIRRHGTLVYEDLGHLELDIECLHYFYTIDNNHYGLTLQDFKAISNTVLNTIYSENDNGFHQYMNGTGDISMNGFGKFIYLFYYNSSFEDFICNYSLEKGRGLSPQQFVRVLEYKEFMKNNNSEKQYVENFEINNFDNNFPNTFSPINPDFSPITWTYTGSSGFEWTFARAGSAFETDYSPLSGATSAILRFGNRKSYIETSELLTTAINKVSFITQHVGDTSPGSHTFELTVYDENSAVGGPAIEIHTVIDDAHGNPQVVTFSGLAIPINRRIRITQVSTNKGNALIDDITLNGDAILSNKEFNKNKVSIYPNPFKDNLNIKLKESDEFSFQIISLIGQVMYTSATHKDHANVSVTNLSKGVYVLKINTEGNSYTKRIVKN
tara:strand:- start:16301 stop:18286 length:1986 start_codon:yes stop_codon:yes gene_type:complete